MQTEGVASQSDTMTAEVRLWNSWNWDITIHQQHAFLHGNSTGCSSAQVPHTPSSPSATPPVHPVPHSPSSPSATDHGDKHSWFECFSV